MLGMLKTREPLSGHIKRGAGYEVAEESIIIILLLSQRASQSPAHQTAVKIVFVRVFPGSALPMETPQPLSSGLDFN